MSAISEFESLGGQRVSPDLLLDAAVPLNLSGEAVRGRICTFIDERGQEWALRPDLTLPVALAEIENRQESDIGPQTRCYSGSVFRLPALPGEPVEYTQIGLERFGYASGPDADCEMVDALIAACRAEGVETAAMRVGDLAIFPAFIDALGLNPPVASAIKRAFRQEGGVRAYFAGQENARARRGLSARLSGLPRADVQDFVEDVFALTGLQPIGDRTADEIVERLFQKEAESLAPGLNDDIIALILELLAIDVPLMAAASELRRLADAAGLTALDGVLTAFDARAERLSKAGVSDFITQAHFATRFGRRFTYYDGFVFEFAASLQDQHASRPFAAGGRYDALISRLSDAQLDVSAIGGIVIPHRLQAMLEGTHD